MYKVFIVDDDFLLRNHLKLMVDWEQAGYVLCGEAENGLQALEQIGLRKPDIVLSDVRMPVMDGLQLAAHMKEQYPETKVIFMSNYDDYDYVRSALKLGVADYVLKHAMNRELLLDTLGRTAQLIRSSSEARTASQDNQSLNNLLPLRERFVIQLLTDFYKNPNEIEMHLRTLEIKLGMTHVLPVMMLVDDYKTLGLVRNLRDASLIEFSIVNIIGEILEDSENGVVVHIENDRYVLLLSFEKSRSQAAMDNALKTLLDRIQYCLKKFINITVSFSIGTVCNHISKIRQGYESAQKLLDEKFFTGKGCILMPKALQQRKSSLTGLGIEVEKRLLADIKNLSTELLEKDLQGVFEWIQHERLDEPSARMIFNDLLSMIGSVCKEKGIRGSDVYENSTAPYDALNEFETLDSVKEWFRKLFHKLISLLEYPAEESAYSNYVKKTIAYIKSHYPENISLTTAAENINISSVYLSMLFKDEVGTGFAEYLMKVRLEKAKELLREGRLEIRDIAKTCGFTTYSYFFNAFKKKTGVTPGEYKEKIL